MSTIDKPTYRDMRSRAEELADESIKERVLKGLDALREKHGDDWVNHINPETLDLGDTTSCVLGQVYGEYEKGLNDLGDICGTDHGFDTDGESYGQLTDSWRWVITGDDEYLLT